MNISQLARNQQMMYNFIHKSGNYSSQIQTQFSGFDALNSTNQGAGSLLQKMGVSGLKGRTVREMAKYQLELQENAQISQQNGTGLDIGSLAQKFPVRTQYTPISDKATAAMQNLALQDAVNSVGNAFSSNSEDRVSLIQEQLKSVDPSKRTAAFNTMNKVWESELDRIGEYIKEKDPSWNNWGDQFDTDILKDYKPGINILV